MNKKIVLAGLALSLLSSICYADGNTSKIDDGKKDSSLKTFSQETTQVEYELIRKKSNGDLVNRLGYVGNVQEPIPVQLGWGKNADKDGECLISKKTDNELWEFTSKNFPTQNVTATLLALESNEKSVKTLLIFNENKYVSDGQPFKITDTCSITNAVASSNSVKWVGDLKFGETHTIKLLDGETLDITLKKVNK